MKVAGAGPFKPLDNWVENPPKTRGFKDAWGVSGLWVVFFITTGLLIVVPQLFFQRYYPASKQLLLTTTLFIGTLAEMAGLKLGGRLLARRGTIGSPSLLIVATVALFSTLYLVHDYRLFVAIQALTTLSCGYLTVILDWLGMRQAGLEQRALNDRIVNIFKLTGAMLGPIACSLLQHHPAQLLAGIGILATWAACGVPRGLTAASAENAAPRDPGQPLQQHDLIFIAYAILLMGMFSLAGAVNLFFLRDYARISHPEWTGGLLFAGTALGAALLVTTCSRWAVSVRRLPWLLVAPLGIALSVYSCTVHWRHPLAVLLPGSLALGCLFGLITVLVRDRVSQAVVHGNKKVYLESYNNWANQGALIAFALLYLVAQIAKGDPHRIHDLALALVAAWALAGVGLAPAVSRTWPSAQNEHRC